MGNREEGHETGEGDEGTGDIGVDLMTLVRLLTRGGDQRGRDGWTSYDILVAGLWVNIEGRNWYRDRSSSQEVGEE